MRIKLLISHGTTHLHTHIHTRMQVTAVVDNELSQLDSSVYTQIFIPSDGEINPSALKYRDQVRTDGGWPWPWPWPGLCLALQHTLADPFPHPIPQTNQPTTHQPTPRPSGSTTRSSRASTRCWRWPPPATWRRPTRSWAPDSRSSGWRRPSSSSSSPATFTGRPRPDLVALS